MTVKKNEISEEFKQKFLRDFSGVGNAENIIKEVESDYNRINKVDNYFWGEGGFLNYMGKGIKQATYDNVVDVYNRSGERFDKILEATKDEDGYNSWGDYIAATAGVGISAIPNAVGNVAAGAGTVVGGLMETADDLTGEVVSDAVMPTVEEIMSNEGVQNTIAEWNEWNEKSTGLFGSSAETLLAATGVNPTKQLVKGAAESAVVKGVAKAGYNTVRHPVKTAGQVASGVIHPVQTVKKTTNSLKFIQDRNALAKSKGITKQEAETLLKHNQKVAGKADDVASLESSVIDEKLGYLKNAEEIAERQNKLATEILQEGNKANSGRAEEFSNAAKQLVEEIKNFPEVEKLTTYQQMAEFVGGRKKEYLSKVDELIQKNNVPVNDNYLRKLLDETIELSKSSHHKKATKKFQEVLFNEIEDFKKMENPTVSDLQIRKKELGKITSKLYENGKQPGGKANLNQTEIDAFENLRSGLQKEIEKVVGVAGKELKELNRKASALIEAEKLLKLQRTRGNKANSGINFAEKDGAGKVFAGIKAVQDYIPMINDLGKGKGLTKLESQSGFLQDLMPARVRAIRKNAENIAKKINVDIKNTGVKNAIESTVKADELLKKTKADKGVKVEHIAEVRKDLQLNLVKQETKLNKILKGTVKVSKSVVEQTKKVISYIKDKIKEFNNAIKKWFGVGDLNKQSGFINLFGKGKKVDDLEKTKALKRLKKAKKVNDELKGKQKNKNDLKKRGKPTEDLSKTTIDFKKGIEYFEKGKLNSGKKFLISTEGELQKYTGIKKLTLTQKVLKEKLKRHKKDGLTIEDVKKLDKEINNPLVLHKSGTKHPRVLVITNIKKGENRVAVAIKENPNIGKMEVAEIKSIHPKNAKKFIEEHEVGKTGKILFENKKLLFPWLGVSSLQSIKE